MIMKEKELMIELFRKLVWAIGDLRLGGDAVSDNELEDLNNTFAELEQLVKETN